MKTIVVVRVATASAAWVAASAALAAPFDAKPGLWETKVTTETHGAMPMDMSKMPPEARARLEAMMKKREAMGPRTHTHQSCVTQKELDERGGNFGSREHCTTNFTTRTATHVAGTMTCDESGVKQSSDFDYQAQGREKVTGVMHMTMMGPGGTQKVAVQMDSQWLGSDCKGIKPGH